MKKVLLSVVAAMCLATATLAQTVPNYVPTNGLVGWWPFNGNATDESGNGNNGTVNGATLTTDRFGVVGKAYSFDGTNKIDLGSLSVLDTLNLNKNITYSIWFKADQNQSNFDKMPLISKRQAPWTQVGTAQSYFTLHGGGQSFYNRNNKYICYGFVDAHMYANGINNGLDGGQTDDNLWHHVIAVKLGTNYKLYFDGIQIDSIYDSRVLYSSDNMVVGYQGVWGFNSEKWFKGNIDDIGIWNRALTQQEITNLYNANICYDHVTVTDTLIINTNMVGFNPVTYQNTIKVWPNPAHDHITIDNGNIANLNGYQIKISNVLGQQVFQSAINQQQFYINLSTWTGNGTYYINLINPQGVTVETRVIVVQ